MTGEQRGRLSELLERYGYWTNDLKQSQQFQTVWAQIQTNIAKISAENPSTPTRQDILEVPPLNQLSQQDRAEIRF